MDQNDELAMVAVIDSSRCLLAKALDFDSAITLIALVSEDPANWEEAASVWPRYRTPVVAEFVSNLPLEETDRDETLRQLALADAWVAIDFPSKRVLTGGQFMRIERDAIFAMEVGESGDQHDPLSIHLPPWWELHKSASIDAIHQPRQAPATRPHVDRHILYGNALFEDIAARVLEVVHSNAWNESETHDKVFARHPFTIRVHRDWLMTPRADLGGRMPRELLHGAREWSDRVTWGQRRRIEAGSPAIATPNDWPGFDTAPMGSQEICLYFDLCRELIGLSWFWCENEGRKLSREQPDLARGQLTQFLAKAKEDWLREPFEGGPPPSFLIQCDRRRVPVGAGVAIDGMDEVPAAQHLSNCDCPICEMIADGMFGISFSSIDGHHLELDDEFAFSLHETREAWEEQQREYAEFAAGVERQRAERQEEDEYQEKDDDFASAWSGLNTDEPFPGVGGGHLKMAFMVAEIVSTLESLAASREEIKGLNACFASYRQCEDEQRTQRATEFKATLQSLADHYPSLITKSSDLQSRIDEALRTNTWDDNDAGYPFSSFRCTSTPIISRSSQWHFKSSWLD